MTKKLPKINILQHGFKSKKYRFSTQFIHIRNQQFIIYTLAVAVCQNLKIFTFHLWKYSSYNLHSNNICLLYTQFSHLYFVSESSMVWSIFHCTSIYHSLDSKTHFIWNHKYHWVRKVESWKFFCKISFLKHQSVVSIINLSLSLSLMLIDSLILYWFIDSLLILYWFIIHWSFSHSFTIPLVSLHFTSLLSLYYTIYCRESSIFHSKIFIFKTSKNVHYSIVYITLILNIQKSSL